jgi:hypothetical protein
MAYVDGIVATVLTANRETTTANSKATAESKPRADHNPIRQPPKFQGIHLPDLGLHPLVLVTISGIAWFLAVTWLTNTGGPTVKPVWAIVAGLFVMFLTLCLAAAPGVVALRRALSVAICGTKFDLVSVQWVASNVCCAQGTPCTKRRSGGYLRRMCRV